MKKKKGRLSNPFAKRKGSLFFCRRKKKRRWGGGGSFRLIALRRPLFGIRRKKGLECADYWGNRPLAHEKRKDVGQFVKEGRRGKKALREQSPSG